MAPPKQNAAPAITTLQNASIWIARRSTCSNRLMSWVVYSWSVVPDGSALVSEKISLVFIDYYTMDPLFKIAHRPEVFTAPFVYIRFLGNHKEMDAAVARARELGLLPHS